MQIYYLRSNIEDVLITKAIYEGTIDKVIRKIFITNVICKGNIEELISKLFILPK